MKRITVLILLTTTLLGCTQSTSQHTSEKPASEIEVKNEQTISVQQNEKNIYVPTMQYATPSQMTKEDVLTKLINTIDHFETAEGKFEMLRNGYTKLVEYKVSPQAGFSTVFVMNEKGVKTKEQTIYYKDEKVWSVDEVNKAVREKKYQLPTSKGTLTPTEAYQKNANNESIAYYRERPPIGLAQTSLFPYEIASNFAGDLDKWDIEKDNEKLLGRNAIVMKGTLNKSASKKQNADTFRFWVDKDAGILIKFELYNAKGEVVDYLRTSEIKVNVPINIGEIESRIEQL
ncbi:outer membrane lipoprotein-sorting protein [Brevibacillus antibioticus]|uniref:Outer membrane lipoprotein-sorting protein n=1 Tax=Brevibacillus antibioticus TaxID=2570228 RepID=A0A4U2Y682_9BACL|nr:outer membrane lipoprotein-sorting protein [Brevibacillus antibioticus]TKI55645.1 outer membrane lipoprotein-sorting protein [Brevibacillus antibioticus]